jgi:hypothetical protein
MPTIDDGIILLDDNNHPGVVLKEERDEDVAMADEGRHDVTLDSHEKVLSLDHDRQEEEEQTQLPIQPPEQQPTTTTHQQSEPSTSTNLDETYDEDAIGRAEFINSMKLDQNKEGGDDPFTEEEKIILEQGVNKIKAAIANTTKTKVRTASANYSTHADTI